MTEFNNANGEPVTESQQDRALLLVTLINKIIGLFNDAESDSEREFMESAMHVLSARFGGGAND